MSRSAPVDKSYRLLVVVNDLRPYGAQRVVVDLLREWSNLGYACTLATLEIPRQDDLSPPTSVRALSLRRSGGRYLGTLRLLWRARRLVVGESPDIIFSNMVFANWLVLLALRSIPARRRPVVAVTEHSLTRNVAFEPSGQMVSRLAALTYGWADVCIGVSRAVTQDMASRYEIPAEKTATIYNPVDIVRVRRQAEGPAPHLWLRPEAGRPTTVVSVGRLVPVKDQETIIRALAQTSDARLLLVGEGELGERLHNLASSLGLENRVAFLGHRNDAPLFMRYADAVISSSVWEGFGLTVIEAAAVGTPVLVSDVPALNELVPALIPGDLFPQGDALALAKLLEESPTPSCIVDLDRFCPASVAMQYLTVVSSRF